MGRTILAVIVGIVALSLCVAGIEMIAHRIYPPPAGLDFNNPETLKAMIAKMPRMALVLVMVGWGVGSLVGGFVAAKISRLHKRGAAIAVGVIMLLLIGANIAMIPHPVWMMMISLLLPIPLALLGWKLATRA